MNPQSGKSIGNFRGAILDAFVIPHNSLKLNVAVVDLVARAVQEVPVDPEV
jgi:hypothetical protein